MNTSRKEIENRIQTSRENIEQSNMKQAAANADKAVEDWKISVLEREYLDNVQEERVTLLVAEIAKIQKEGSLAESATDVNYHTARKIEKEVENFYYEMITRRMSAEAAKKSAENMLKKIENQKKQCTFAVFKKTKNINRSKWNIKNKRL
jgi:uncharacterized small protein (DUF1192 family)